MLFHTARGGTCHASHTPLLATWHALLIPYPLVPRGRYEQRLTSGSVGGSLGGSLRLTSLPEGRIGNEDADDADAESLPSPVSIPSMPLSPMDARGARGGGGGGGFAAPRPFGGASASLEVENARLKSRVTALEDAASRTRGAMSEMTNELTELRAGASLNASLR